MTENTRSSVPEEDGRAIVAYKNNTFYIALPTPEFLKREIIQALCYKEGKIADEFQVNSVLTIINQQIKSVLDELESELDDGKNSHSMKVISSTIQKIRSRYE